MASAAQVKQPEQPSADILAAEAPRFALDWKPDPNRVLNKVLHDRRGKRMLSLEEMAYVDAYLKYGVPAEAARLAGYKDPGGMGHQLRKRLAGVIAKEAEDREQKSISTPKEVLERFELWARSGGEAGSAVSVKANELLGRAMGVLSDRVDVRIDIAELRAQLSEALSDPQRLMPKAEDGLIELEPAPVADETL
jgi:hypothetical protein